MNYLVIIGNGFDLAHNLKTDYNSFIKYLVESQIKNRKLEPQLFTINVSTHATYKGIMEAIKHSNTNQFGYNFTNNFFRNILKKVSLENWCDVESEYFQQLKILDNTNGSKKLNEEFEDIKTHLENYLKNQQEKISIPDESVYNNLFEYLNGSLTKSLLLDFNYTSTIEKYIELNQKLHSINIHGKLEEEKNPIIFGYAANDEEARELLNKNDNELLRNVKKHCYKRTDNEEKLKKYLLEVDTVFSVIILGHSCGISDKLILNQIFNHHKLGEIKVFYHEEYENYRQAQVNIDRIMENDSQFTKLVNFQKSYRMPQLNDTLDQRVAFINYIKSQIR